MFKVSLIAAILFFCGFVYNLTINDQANATVQIILVFLLLLFAIAFKRDRRHADEFMKWLEFNHYQIFHGGAYYNGILIDRDTVIIQYDICFSLVFTFTSNSGIYVKKSKSAKLRKLQFILFALIFGWWSIPFGPINTVKAVYNNLFRKPIRIDDIMEEY